MNGRDASMTKYERAIYNIVRMSREHLTVHQIFERLKMGLSQNDLRKS